MNDAVSGIQMSTRFDDEGRPRIQEKRFGFDPEEYVETRKKAASIGLEKVDKEIDQIDERLKKINELKGQTVGLQNATQDLYDYHPAWGVGALGKLSAVLNTNDTVNTKASDIIMIDVSGDAKVRQFDIEVKQLASYDFTASTTAIADKTAALGWTGSFDLNLSGNAATTINVNNTMSFEGVRDAINAQSPTTKIQATIMTDAAGSYLRLQSSESGKQVQIALANLLGDNVGEMPVASGKSDADLSATVEIDNDGVDRIYQTNKLSDLFDGMTVSLFRTNEADKTVTVTLEPNYLEAKKAIATFVDTYNKMNDFLEAESKATIIEHADGTQEISGDQGLLYRTMIMRHFKSDIRPLVTAAVPGLGSSQSISSLSDIGIRSRFETGGSTEENPLSFGRLEIDENLLDEKLLGHFEEVKRLFTYTETTDDERFFLVSHGVVNRDIQVNSADGSPVQISVVLKNDGNDNITAELTAQTGVHAGKTFVVPADRVEVNTDPNSDRVFFRGDFATLEGTTSPFTGLKFSYKGAAALKNASAQTITANMSVRQGYGDLMNESLRKTLNNEPTLEAINGSNYTIQEHGEFKEQEELLMIKKEAFLDQRERVERKVQKAVDDAMREMQQFQEMTTVMMQIAEMVDMYFGAFMKGSGGQ